MGMGGVLARLESQSAMLRLIVDDDFNERDYGLQTAGCKYLDESELLNMIRANPRNIHLHSNTSIHANRRFPKDKDCQQFRTI